MVITAGKLDDAIAALPPGYLVLLILGFLAFLAFVIWLLTP